MSVLEQTDYPTLSLGHTASCLSVSIVGLDVKVYGLEEIKGSTKSIAALIATHGRMNNQKNTAHIANGVLGHIGQIGKGKNRARDLIVVTVDQRNHGTRLKDRLANHAYDKNPRHFIDMAACVVGGCHDVSLIIDFLAAYIFLHDERVIDEWIATGVSLGGNQTYRLLRVEPRIRIAIPMIGLPFESFSTYLGARAVSMSIPFQPPTYPNSLKPIIDPEVDLAVYRGKRILSLHGGDDKLVPYAQGEKRIKEIQAEVNSSGGAMEVTIEQGVGHAISVTMVKQLAEWVWRWALAPGEEAESKPVNRL